MEDYLLISALSVIIFGFEKNAKINTREKK